MNTPDESFTISSKKTLLPVQQSSPPKPKFTKNLIPILFSLLTVFIFLGGSMILSVKRTDRTIQPSKSYGLSQYYCHLTRYPNLCYHSMSFILNLTEIESNPNLIFSASTRVAIHQLEDSSVSIRKSLSSSTDKSRSESSLRECENWVNDSLSQLNESLSAMGIDRGIESLTYEEIDSIKAQGWVASNGAFKCVKALKEIGEMVEGEDKMGVEEVKYGLELARKYIINSVKLVDARDSILDDFYNPLVNIESDDYYYYDYSYDRFDFTFLVCLYSGLYLFLALLYFLFWCSD